MKKTLLIFAIIIFVTLGFAGKYVMGLSLSTLNNPFFVELRDGALSMAETLDVDLIVTDAQDNAAKQLNDIEDLIQQGVDLIMINPTDGDAIVTAVEEANEEGIPVITIDRGSNGGKLLCHIASDNVAGGRMAGEYVAELLGGTGNIVELEGIIGTSAARDRGKGFGEAMQNYSGLNIIAKQTANFNRAEGLVVMENILEANPDIDAVFAHNDEMALGAIEAIIGAGREDDIIVVGFDAVDDAVNSVKKGEMKATVAQQPFVMGELGVLNGFNYLLSNTIYIPVDLMLVTE